MHTNACNVPESMCVVMITVAVAVAVATKSLLARILRAAVKRDDIAKACVCWFHAAMVC